MKMRRQGCSFSAIACELGLKQRTVRSLCARLRQRGEQGLAADYSRCGLHGCQFDEKVRQSALAYRKAHPRWGGGYIRVELEEQLKEQLDGSGEPLEISSVRTLQRWFRAAGLSRLRSQAPPSDRTAAAKAHDVWQVDAKERMHLADGSPSCVLSVTDEGTGATLGLVPFPPVSLEAGCGPPGAAGLPRAV